MTILGSAVIPNVVNEWVNYESCTQVLTSFCQSRSIPDQVVWSWNSWPHIID